MSNTPRFLPIPTLVENYPYLDFAARNTRIFVKKQIKQEILLSSVPALITAVVVGAVTGSPGFAGIAASGAGLSAFAVLVMAKFCQFYWIAPRRLIRKLNTQLTQVQAEKDRLSGEMEAARGSALIEKGGLEARIEKLIADKAPQFSIIIETCIFGQAHLTLQHPVSGEVKTLTQTGVSPWMGIQNLGEPSIAQNWRLQVFFAVQGGEIHMEILPYVASGTQKFNVTYGPSFEVDEKDNLINKAGPGHPIAKGDRVNGMVMFLVPPPSETEAIDISRMIVEVEDITGTVYSTPIVNISGEPSYIRPYMPNFSVKPVEPAEPEAAERNKRKRRRAKKR